MEEVPTSGVVRMSDLMAVAGIAQGSGPVSMSSLVKGGAHFPNISENANIPASTTNGMAMSKFRGARKTPLATGFKMMSSGKALKYDSVGDCVRFNTGTEIMFEVIDTASVFNNSQTSHRRVAFRDVVSGLYLARNGNVFTMREFVSNDPNFAFRFVTFNNVHYRIFNDTQTLFGTERAACTYTAPGTINTNDYTNFPFCQTFLAYNPTPDTVIPMSWKWSNPLLFTFENISLVSSAISSCLTAGNFNMPYPSRGLTSNSTNVTSVIYGTGTHTVSATSQGSTTRQAWNAFDFSMVSLDNAWQPTTADTQKYIEIELPVAIRLYSYLMDCSNDINVGTVFTRAPQGWRLEGFEPGSTTPVELHNGSRSHATLDIGIKHYVLNTNTFYKKFRFTITAQFDSLVSVPELRFFGRTV